MADKQTEQDVITLLRAGQITEQQAEEILRASSQSDQPQPQTQPVTPQEPTFGSEAAAVATQGTGGIADFVGLPVDLVSNALKATGVISPDTEPFGGSESIKRFIQALGGAVDVEPQTPEGRFAGEAVRIAGGGLPLAGAAARSGQIGREIGSLITSSLGAQAGIEAARELAPDSAAAELAGGVIGGGLPTLARAGAEGAIRRGLRGNTQAATQESIERAAQVGVRPTLGDVAQGGAARQIQSALTKMPGGRRINRDIQRTADDVAESVRAITGASQTQERAGRTILKGIEGFVGRFNARANTLFDDVAIPGNRSIRVDKTRHMLKEISSPVEGFEQTSSSLVSPKIREVAASFAQDVGEAGAVPYEAMKRLRSQIGRQLSTPSLVDDIPRAELKKVYGAITDDLKAAAQEAGKLKEFNRANAFYRSGLKRVDDQLKNIAKHAEPEKVFKAAMAGASDGPTRLRTIKKSLTPEEWDLVAKTQLSRMGKRLPSQSGVEEGFSINTFLTNYNRMDPASRKVMFSGNLDRSVDDIAKVVDDLRVARSVGANPSGSAGGIADIATTALLAGGAFEPSLAVLASLGIGSSNVTARLFSSPDFIRWVGQSTRVRPENFGKHVGQLSTIARQNPEIAEEIEQYLKGLTGNE